MSIASRRKVEIREIDFLDYILTTYSCLIGKKTAVSRTRLNRDVMGSLGVPRKKMGFAGEMVSFLLCSKIIINNQAVNH